MTDATAAVTESPLSVFNLKAAQEFATDRRVRKALVKGGQIDIEMICYEPGQSSPMHSHPRQDEIFYVVEGRVNLNIGGVENAYDEGTMIRFGPGIPHDVRNLSAKRCTIVFLKSAIGLVTAASVAAKPSPAARPA